MSNVANLGAGGLRPLRFADPRGIMDQATKCFGEHELYVAEVVSVEAEGKIIVITVCRHCDRVTFHSETVFTPQHSAIFLKNKEKEKE